LILQSNSTAFRVQLHCFWQPITMLLLGDIYTKINQREGMSTTKCAHCSASKTTFINKSNTFK